MGASDEGARIVQNLVTIVGGIFALTFLGAMGYLVVSCMTGN